MKKLLQFALLIGAVQGFAQDTPTVVVQNVESWHQKWLADDRALSEQIRMYGTDSNYFKAKGIDPWAKIAELRAKREVQDAKYSKMVKATLASASSLKVRLRKGSKASEEDKAVDAIFAKSAKGGTIHFSDMRQVKVYMESK